MVCLIKSDERKMKKYLSAIVSVLLTAGCSWLNPFSSETPQPTAFEPNQFMWQAAHDKLAFMPVAEEDKKAGVMTTAWQKSDNADNTEFKIEVKDITEKTAGKNGVKNGRLKTVIILRPLKKNGRIFGIRKRLIKSKSIRTNRSFMPWSSFRIRQVPACMSDTLVHIPQWM